MSQRIAISYALSLISPALAQSVGITYTSNEFRFWPRGLNRRLVKLGIVSRDKKFRSSVSLRRNSSDFSCFEQIFIKNDYSLSKLERWADIVAIYKKICERATPLILDLGGNIGLSSLYFAKNWPEAHIIVLEPDADNFAMLCQNVGGCPNIQPVRAAVADKDGFVRIANPESEAWSYRTQVADADAIDRIPAYSVESITALAPSGEYAPFYAKVDIEGFEKNLFSANTEWVERFPLITMELHDWMLPRQAASASFLRTISHLNRDFVQVGENMVSIANECLIP